MFFITLFEHLPEKEAKLDIGDRFTCGYFDNYQECKDSLELNEFGFGEGYYNYAVVEEIGQGIYMPTKERQFFKYNKEKDKYFEIEEPETLKRFYNFSVG